MHRRQIHQSSSQTNPIPCTTGIVATSTIDLSPSQVESSTGAMKSDYRSYEIRQGGTPSPPPPAGADLRPWLHSHRIHKYLRLLDYIATSDEKSTYLAREKLHRRRGESSVEAREGR